MAKNKYSFPGEKKKKSFFKILAFIIIFIVLIGVGIGYYMWYSLNKVTASTEEKINPKDDIEADLVEADEAVNILIMGADYVKGENEDFSRRRTDTMMVVHFNPKTHEALVTSVPRDTQVTYNKKEDKINNMNVRGGPAMAVPAVEKLLDIDINYYILLDYTAFGKIVDDLGGVTVTIQHDMKYDDEAGDLHIDFKKGEVVNLDGQKAQEFFRWRHNNEDEPTADTIDAGGDLGRIENQKIFIKAAIKKISSPTVITKIPKLVDTAAQSIITNMSSSDIIKYGVSLSKTNLDDIQFVTMPGIADTDEDGAWWYFKNEEKTKILSGAINNDKPYLDRGTLSVQLKNSSTKQGVCTSLREEMVEEKFYDFYFVHFDEDSGSAEPAETSTIDLYGIDEKYDELILEDFKSYGITKINHHKGKGENNSDIVITIGKDATIP